MSFAPQLHDFIGSWTIDRRIDDRLGGIAGRFDGRATFAPAAATGLDYREEGWLRLGKGQALRALRRYLWRAEAGRIVVDHADGRRFHAFDPADPQARHHCDPDLYRVRYDFADWPRWTAMWVVSGPCKDYTMTSLYTRAESGA